jgi:nucleoside phosphorylase
MLTVCLASSKEAADLFFSARHFTPPNLRVAVTGFRNSLLKTSEKELAGNLLAVGFAGALNPAWKAGDLVVPAQIAAAGQEPRTPAPALRRWLMEALKTEGARFHEGALLTVDRPVTSEPQRARLFEQGYDAVDMESYALVDRAVRADNSAAVLRLVSDNADERADWDYRRNLEELARNFSRILFRVLERYGEFSE